MKKARKAPKKRSSAKAKSKESGRILAAYVHYYNDVRTHLALNKNTPAERVVQRAGSITSDRTDT